MAQLPLVRTAVDIPTALPRWKSQLDPVLANLLLNGQQILDVVLTTTPTLVNHSLGRVPTGWLLSDINASATVFRTSPMTNSSIPLQASVACTVSLWVY